MSLSQNFFRKTCFFEPFFYFMYKKLWYQMKFLIQDLILFSCELSLLSLKSVKKPLVFLNKNKLLSFYHKFKKILKKYLSVPRRIFFLLSIIKTEIIYTEDKIIFIENELAEFKKTPLPWNVFFLITCLLCRYYIFLGIRGKKWNWGNQYAILVSKKKKKNKFFKLVSELTQNHLNKKIKAGSGLSQIIKEYSLFADIFYDVEENKKLLKRTQLLLSLDLLEERKKKKKSSETRKIQPIPKNSITNLLFKSASIRNNLEKTDWYFDLNIHRIKRKKNKITEFLDKPKKSLTNYLAFSNFQKKKMICSVLNVYERKSKRKNIRWSIFSKLLMFCFPEAEIFFSVSINKDNNRCFIDQNRQLINKFFFVNYLPDPRENLHEDKGILWRRVLFTFFHLPASFFFGWSFF